MSRHDECTGARAVAIEHKRPGKELRTLAGFRQPIWGQLVESGGGREARGALGGPGRQSSRAEVTRGAGPRRAHSIALQIMYILDTPE